MIPISKSQRMKHKDEASGITYEFKPLIGEPEIALQEAVQFFSKLQPGNDVDFRSMTNYLDTLINSVLVGWSGPDGTPAFCEYPASLFSLSDKKAMLDVIVKINGLTGDEKKN